MVARWYRGAEGDERLWLDRADIESMMEDELQKASLLPPASAPTVDLEGFLERYLRVTLDQHAQLPADVLGLTEFRQHQRPLVLINRDLTGSAIDDEDSAPGLVGRWRATLAHEASHVVIHRPLFELTRSEGNLFGGNLATARHGPDAQLMRCYKTGIVYRGAVRDWREIQANQGMASLLMPRSVFLQVVAAHQFRPHRLESDSPESRDLIARLASSFTVSRQAAAIRLETLGVVALRGQAVLA